MVRRNEYAAFRQSEHHCHIQRVWPNQFQHWPAADLVRGRIELLTGGLREDRRGRSCAFRRSRAALLSFLLPTSIIQRKFWARRPLGTFLQKQSSGLPACIWGCMAPGTGRKVLAPQNFIGFNNQPENMNLSFFCKSHYP